MSYVQGLLRHPLLPGSRSLFAPCLPHLPGVFHPGDIHGISPFRGLTSLQAGSLSTDPALLFLGWTRCRAAHCDAEASPAAGRANCQFLLVLDEKAGCARLSYVCESTLPSLHDHACALSSCVVADPARQLRGLPGSPGCPRWSPMALRSSRTVPRMKDGWLVSSGRSLVASLRFAACLQGIAFSSRSSLA